ncbi:molybdate ABC transporter substrate-binding protein [Mycobacterium heckeshornense]|uniref:Molybdate-binding protein n=1 Tax=Mycobacterium heckeshornense TaxID=110505 RepID=A0A2G8BDE6_9MYCO|nr:molybdate ABC transporter substrate-binding protein [Mycobacterium heckeshornense]KMV21483.1 molybdate-binding protein [Mycobacterium heckeshornense]MCV7035891.1 molybdate ABC transporter substrate-binding protein [Mycobacterium heckeshornense]PIJ35754.1 molybdate ABC transporter substrate-binding protein [Mycobacterium heckeshornense]BCO35918.1 molybdate-binding protein [Mycobacterium heckeshornense]
MRRILVRAALVSLLLVAGLTGCRSTAPPTSPTPPSSPSAAKPLLVFAAASLRPVFDTIAEQFKTENPGAAVDIDYAGSSELATQLTQGGTADVFASADTVQMDKVAKAGLLAGKPVDFASNTLVVVTGPGNPKQVRAFADLTKPGLAVTVCQQPVPCGAATQRIENNTGVHLNPVSEEPSVTDVLNKVTSGQADAGLVYLTDAINAGTKVVTVNFPEAAAARNIYPIAVLQHSPHPQLARKFIDTVTGETGQKALHQAGFAKP